MIRTWLVGLALSVFLIQCAVATPADYFSAADEASYKALIKEKGTENLANAFHAVNTFPGELKSSDACKLAEKALDSKDLGQIFQAATVLTSIKCTFKVSDDTTKKLTEGLESGSLVDKYHAVSAITRLSANKHISVASKALVAAFDKIVAQADTDGTFKLGTEADGSPYYAGLAYQALSDLYSVLDTDAKKDKLATISGSVEKLLKAADEQEQGVALVHGDSSISTLQTTSAVVQGIVKLAAALGKSSKVTASSATLAKLASFLVSQKSAGSLAQADLVYNALKALNAGTLRKPIAVTVTPTSIQAAAKKEEAVVKVKVSDLFGGAVPGVSVFLTKASSNAATPLISNQELTSDDKTTFNFHLLAVKPEPGSYTLELRATVKDTAKWVAADAVTRNVKVVSSVALYEGQLTVGDKDDESADSSHALTANDKLKADVNVAAGKLLYFSFRLKNKVSAKPVAVQQAFVTFTNQETGEDTFFVTPYDQGKKLYKLKVDASKFKNASGKYTVHIIIGDANIDNSFDWQVGTVVFNFKGEPAAKKQSIFVPPKEINHIFRKAEVRPPAIVSQAFTLLVLAPLGLLLVGWVVVGINFSNFPVGLASLTALAFHVSLAALVGVYGLFFLELNLFETLKYLAIVGLALIVFGHPTLRAVALKRTKAAPAN